MFINAILWILGFRLIENPRIKDGQWVMSRDVLGNTIGITRTDNEGMYSPGWWWTKEKRNGDLSLIYRREE